MLSIRNLASSKQAAHYFEKDDYYTKDQTLAPSAWFGKGAKALGLSGEVDREVFKDLLSGQLPSGEPLPSRPDKKRRPGIDLTFSAPKSVSIVALVQQDHRVLKAHDDAVAAALESLERDCAQARTKIDGNIRAITTENLVVARFHHDTSRDLDPQLHTHAVVLNATQCGTDGPWRALWNQQLYRSKMLGGAIYRAELAVRLKALGYEITKTHRDGRFEIAGFETPQLEGFSQRRAAIEAHLKAIDRKGAVAAKVAALATRDKKRDFDRARLREAWKRRAQELGLETRRRPTKRRVPGRVLDQGKSRDAVDFAVQHLSERKSVFSARDVQRHALIHGLGHVTAGQIEQAIGALEDNGELIFDQAKGPGARRFTTKQALASERALIAHMRLGHGSVDPILDRRQIERSLDLNRLTRGQQQAVRLILGTKDQVVGVQGYAGTGKTTALEEVRAKAERAGYVVKGFSTSAAAAQVLTEAGIQSTTVARHLLERECSVAVPAKPELWIIDEASMLPTKDALALLTFAKRRAARVVLVGDRAQLPAVEAGKPFALLMDQGMQFATLDEIRRQKSPRLLHAVKATLNRDLETALKTLKQDIHVIADRDQRLEAVADAYLQNDDKKSTLVLVGSNRDRQTVNDLIRTGLNRQGALSGPSITTDVLVRRQLTAPQRKEANSYAPGQIVRFGRDYARIGVEKGSYYSVRNARASTGIVELSDDSGSRILWAPKRASVVELYDVAKREIRAGDLIRFTRNDQLRGRINGTLASVQRVEPTGAVSIEVNGRADLLDLSFEHHFDHAYAQTVHSAQGRTSDQVIIHLDTAESQLVRHESFYVALSRARHCARVFTDDDARLPLAISRSMQQQAAIDVATERNTARSISLEFVV